MDAKSSYRKRRRIGLFDGVVLAGAAMNVAVALVLITYWATH